MVDESSFLGSSMHSSATLPSYPLLDRWDGSSRLLRRQGHCVDSLISDDDSSMATSSSGSGESGSSWTGYWPASWSCSSRRWWPWCRQKDRGECEALRTDGADVTKVNKGVDRGADYRQRLASSPWFHDRPAIPNMDGTTEGQCNDRELHNYPTGGLFEPMIPAEQEQLIRGG
jgi:hypothetical protein